MPEELNGVAPDSVGMRVRGGGYELGSNRDGARTFLSAAPPRRSPTPETTVAREPFHLAADKNVRAPSLCRMQLEWFTERR